MTSVGEKEEKANTIQPPFLCFSHLHPTLQAIARDVLAIPVSTIAYESGFSTSGYIVSPHRSRLHPTTLEALMCARRWLWSAENTSKFLIYSSEYECI